MMKRDLRVSGLEILSNVAVQILTPLVFLKIIGAVAFGHWLSFIATAALLAGIDLGLPQASQIALASAYARRDRARFNALANSAFLACLICSGVIGLIGWTGLIVFDGLGSTADNSTLTQIAVMMIAGAALSPINSCLTSLMRAIDRMAEAHQVDIAGKWLEFGAVLCALLAGFGLEGGAWAWLMVRLVMVIALCPLAVYRARAFWRFGSGIQLQPVLDLIRPAFAFSVSNLSALGMVHVPILIVAKSIGPEAAAIFATTRTLSRFGVTMVLALAETVRTRLSRADARRRYRVVSRIIARLFQLWVLAALSWIAALILLGPMVYHLWLGDKLVLDLTLLYLLSLLAVIAGTNGLLGLCLSSLGRAGAVASVQTPLTLLGLGLSVALAQTGFLSLLCAGLLMAEIAIAFALGRTLFHLPALAKGQIGDMIRTPPFWIIDLARTVFGLAASKSGRKE
jgi:O-antigen/teichoic acid export membrane protein